MAAPPFPRAWKRTRDLLHAYVQAIGALPRHHAPPEPFWGERGLRLETGSLATARIPLPAGGHAVARLDLTAPVVTIEAGADEERWPIPITGPGEVAAGIRALAARHGLDVTVHAALDAPTSLEEGLQEAAAFGDVLTFASRLVGEGAGQLPGWAAPERFWPHGFDLSRVWFGGVNPPEGGDADTAPRITLGFDPTTEPYFYVNPWPFHGSYTDCALPDGATWHTRGWRGTLLPYEDATPDRFEALVAAIHAVAAGR